MKFKAVVLDIDGTITEKGVRVLTPEMAALLVKVAKKAPLAFCTGQELALVEKFTLPVLLQGLDSKSQEKFLEKFFLMAESGAIGYFFNKKSARFEEFYRGAWPEEFISRIKLKELIKAKIGNLGRIWEGHQIIIAISANKEGVKNPEEIYERSKKIYGIVKEILASHDKNYEKFLRISKGGMAVPISLAKFDKDTGVKKLGEFLKKTKKIKFDKQFREILLIGDCPKKEWNDHYFLNGKNGTPYTVGYFDKNSKYPLPVLDKTGFRLLHSKGTFYLLEELF